MKGVDRRFPTIFSIKKPKRSYPVVLTYLLVFLTACKKCWANPEYKWHSKKFGPLGLAKTLDKDEHFQFLKFCRWLARKEAGLGYWDGSAVMSTCRSLRDLEFRVGIQHKLWLQLQDIDTLFWHLHACTCSHKREGLTVPGSWFVLFLLGNLGLLTSNLASFLKP